MFFIAGVILVAVGLIMKYKDGKLNKISLTLLIVGIILAAPLTIGFIVGFLKSFFGVSAK